MSTSGRRERSLASGFMTASERFPERPALEVEGLTLSYAELRERAIKIAVTLQRVDPAPETSLTAVLAHRSVTAFAAILGALLRGTGYVPLNPQFPPERTAVMLDRAGVTGLVVGAEAVDGLGAVLEGLERPLVIIAPERAWPIELIERFPQHTFVHQHDQSPESEWSPVDLNPDDIAYLLFTSGSTGLPKGVPVTHSNIRHFIDAMVDRYKVTEQDRFTQMFELVFDLSLFDMFVAWERGACVCCPSKGDAQMPARFLKEAQPTIWFSVPSLALSMKQMRMLRPGAYPQLRLSLFCGEALLDDIAASWSEAAPNSIVENLYGPTEVTLACTAYRWGARKAQQDSEHGLVPIGKPFPGMTAMVADENLVEVAPGECGELLMSGPQVAPGYWQDPDKTAAAFVIPRGHESVFYRTGDLVRRPRDSEPIQYLGRIDHQIKIRGNRVELGEIEAILRAAADVDLAVAIGWPETSSGAEGIVAFLRAEPGTIDIQSVMAQLKSKVPVYMVPRELKLVEEMPLNTNGKVDRKALRRSLERSKQIAGAASS